MVPKETRVTVRLEQQTRDRLEQEARQKDIPLAQLIRAILKKYLQEDKDE